MRIALAQLNPTSGDIDGNAAKILAALDAARAGGADLVVTPEMALPGYCIGDLVEDEGFLAANERGMRRIADAARDITAVIGFIDFDIAARNDSGGLRKYNAAAVIRDGKVVYQSPFTPVTASPKVDGKMRAIPIAGKLALGSDMPAGRYTLEVIVRGPKGKKLERKQWLDFEIRR